MTPRYKLRTLLILLAVLPPVLWLGWGKYQAWKAEQERQRAIDAATADLMLAGNRTVQVPDGGTVLLGGLKQPTVGAADSSDLEHGKGP